MVIVIAGCDSGAGPQPAPPPSPAVTATTAPAGTVPCTDVIGTVPAPDPDLTVIEDAVALPAAARMPVPLQASAQTIEFGAALFAKNGLVVRRRAQVHLRVLEPAAGRAWIGWGSPGELGPQAVVDGCDSAGAWMAFAGGYWVRTPLCVPVGVRVAGSVERRVDIAVGRACPASAAGTPAGVR
jgi:hypothetical protein